MPLMPEILLNLKQNYTLVELKGVRSSYSSQWYKCQTGLYLQVGKNRPIFKIICGHKCCLIPQYHASLPKNLVLKVKTGISILNLTRRGAISDFKNRPVFTGVIQAVCNSSSLIKAARCPRVKTLRWDPNSRPQKKTPAMNLCSRRKFSVADSRHRTSPNNPSTPSKPIM